MEKVPGLEQDKDHPPLYRVDREGQVHPVDGKYSWEMWMEENQKKLRFKMKFRHLGVGVRFLGVEQGWSKGGQPLLWQAAVFVGGKALATIYAESATVAFEKLEEGLRKVVGDAPMLIRIYVSILLFKLRWNKRKIFLKMFDNLKD